MREYLRQRRHELGYTQEDCAKAAGIKRTTYTNIELGKKDPSLKVALRLKQFLKTDDDKIFLVSGCRKGTTKTKAS